MRRPWRTLRLPAPELLEDRTLLTAPTLDVVSSFRVEKDAAVWGDTVTVDYTVANRGTLPSASFLAPLVLSPGNRFNNSAVDQVLATVTLPALGPGQATPPMSLTLQLPGTPGLPPTGFPEPGEVFLGLELPGNSPSPEHGHDWEALPLLTHETASPTNTTFGPPDVIPLNSLTDGTFTGGNTSSFYEITPPTSGRLLARVADSGFPVRLSLFDQYGLLLVQSEGGVPGQADAVIDQHLRVGGSQGGQLYFLEVQRLDNSNQDVSYRLDAEFQTANFPGDFALQAGINLRDSGTGQLHTALVNADFNGDGAPDVANVVNQGNEVSVLLNVGDGTFGNETTYPVGNTPTALVTGDFNGDGVVDLAVLNSGEDDISILLGNGDGTFHEVTDTLNNPVRAAVGNDPVALVAGDFNSDGNTDLAVLNEGDSSVSILSGLGDGTFAPAMTTSLPLAPGQFLTALAAGDLEGGGQSDLALTISAGAFEPGAVAVLHVHADGTLTEITDPHQRPSVGEQPIAIVANDFNGDGRLDLVVANYTSEDVSVLLGAGAGHFTSGGSFALTTTGQREAGYQPFALIAGDFNGDGLLDLALGTDGDGDTLVLTGRGDGTFSNPGRVTRGGWAGPITAADFTGDGRLDLAQLSCDPNGLQFPNNGVLLLTGRGDATFQEGTTDASGFEEFVTDVTGFNALTLASGDFNGDGSPDLATANFDTNDVSILLGDGDGTFQNEVRYPVGVGPRDILVGDFNGDGRPDLAVVDSGTNIAHPVGKGDVTILLGLGDGTFRPVSSAVDPADLGDSPVALAMGDFNDDDIPDLAVANSGSNTVSILLGNGDGTFRAGPQTLAVGTTPVALVAGHLVNGHALDLAVVNQGSNDVSIWLGKGDGTFQPGPQTPQVGLAPDAIVAAHFDTQHGLSLAVANSQGSRDGSNDGSVSVLLGKGDGTFEPALDTPVGPDPLGLVVGDFTGSGNTDLVTADNGTAAFTVLRGTGTGQFTVAGTMAGLGGDPVAVTSADFNRDGRPDLAFTGFTGFDNVELWLGLGQGSFQPPDTVTPSGAQAAPLLVDVNGDGRLDSVVLDRAGNILLRLGQPDGTFRTPITVNPGAPARAFTSVSDGKQTLLAAVAQAGSTVALYAINSTGKPSLSATLNTGAVLPTQIVAGDLRHAADGFDDLAVLDGLGGQVLVLLYDPTTQQFDSPTALSVGNGGINLAPPNINEPADLALADVNGDGSLDLVTTNEDSGDVSVLLNDGTGHFQGEGRYRAGLGPDGDNDNNPIHILSRDGSSAVVAGDLNGDGSDDVVVADGNANRVVVLLGDAFGGLGKPIVLPLGFSPAALALGHFDSRQNNFLDLAVLDQASGVIHVFLGDGAGHLTEKRNVDASGQVLPLLVGAGATGLAVVDANGDGTPDLQVSDPFGDVLTLLGNGDGTFRPFVAPGRRVPLVAADLNGDGVADAVLANEAASQVLAQLRQPGTATFTPGGFVQDSHNGVLKPDALVLTDLNGDGRADLVVANGGSNNVLVYLRQPDGSFAAPRTFFAGTNPVGLTVADLNGDGVPDLVVVNQGSDDVSVLLGEGSGASWTLGSGPRLHVGNGPVAASVRDVNGDGVPDLVVTDGQGGTQMVLPGIGHQGIGTGFFNDANPVVAAIPGQPVITAVSNGFLITQGGALLNERTLQTVFVPPPGIAVRFVVPGPANLLGGGGGPALFVTLTNGTVALLTEDLTGTFTESEVFSSSSLVDPSELAVVADAGQLDLYVTQEGDDVPVVFTLALGVPVAVPAPLLPGEPLTSVLQPLPSAAVPVVPVLVQANQDLLLVADAIVLPAGVDVEGSPTADTASEPTETGTEGGGEETANVSGDTTGGDEGDLTDDTGASDDPATLLDSVKQRGLQTPPPSPDDLLPPENDQPPVEKRQPAPSGPALPVDLPGSEAIGRLLKVPHAEEVAIPELPVQLRPQQVDAVFATPAPRAETGEPAPTPGLFEGQSDGEPVGTAPEILLAALLLTGAALPLSNPELPEECRLSWWS